MSASLAPTTNAADDLPRRRFTVDDVYAMTRAGILDEHERVELIGGELVPMASKGSFHERMKSALNIVFARSLPAWAWFSSETTFRLSRDTFLEPDFVFYDRAVGWDGLAPHTALLAVEVADTSLRYDLGRKASIYAGFGITELWVINAISRETRVHRQPSPSGYGEKRDAGPNDPLVPLRLPELAVNLATLEMH